MAVRDMREVLEFLSRNGFAEAESALRYDILQRGGEIDNPTPPAGSPRLPAPPPPVRVVLGGRRRSETPAVGNGDDDASSSSDSSSSFVSMGSSPSDLVNPFGLWSDVARVKSEDDSSERHTEFDTARDYSGLEIWTDMYWYDERDRGQKRQQCCEEEGTTSCRSEDKFVMDVGAEAQFNKLSGEGSSLLAGQFHSMSGASCLDNSVCLSKNEDFSINVCKDLPHINLLDLSSTPLCDCCSGRKGYCGLVSDGTGYGYGEKEQLGESDISLYGCCFELMSEGPKNFQETGELEEFALKIVNECPTELSWEFNAIGYSHHEALLALVNSGQDPVQNFSKKQLQDCRMVSEVVQCTSNIEDERDISGAWKGNFENTILDDKGFNPESNLPVHSPKNVSLSIGNDTDNGTGNKTDDKTAKNKVEHSYKIDLQMNDNHEEEYEIFNLRIIHRKNRTGFEENKDFPILLNTIIAGRYFITEYLGSAAFSKVIQAHDLQLGMDVCLKIIKNDKEFFDQSLDEIKLLKFVNKYDPADERHILRLYDYFYHQEHLFIVTELLRANLYELQKFNHESGGDIYFSLPRLQRIAQQCLEALEYLHYLGIIHCDLKPENILIKSYTRCEIKVIDLGSSCFQTDNLCLYVQSRSYRAPEVILGLPYDQRIDLWSLGCILAELFSGEVLFQNDSLVMILARMIGMFGPIDVEMLEKGQETYKYFTDSYDLYQRNEDTDQLEYIIPEKCSLISHLQVSDTGFIEFIEELLQMNPERRPTATEALLHPWFNQAY